MSLVTHRVLFRVLFFSAVDPLLPKEAKEESEGRVPQETVLCKCREKKSSVAMTTVSRVDFSTRQTSGSCALKKYVSKRKPEKLFKEWFIIYLYFSPTSEPLEGVSCVRCVLNLSGHSSCVPHIYLFSMSFTLFNIYPAVLCHRAVFKISYMHFIKSHIDKQELFGVASVRSLERTLFFSCIPVGFNGVNILHIPVHFTSQSVLQWCTSSKWQTNAF